jgi:hypothetical protein
MSDKYEVVVLKLAETINMQVGPDPRNGKSVQYIDKRQDRSGQLTTSSKTGGLWTGWEINELPHGVEIIPPYRGTRALIPWSRVAYVLSRPLEVKKESK